MFFERRIAIDIGSAAIKVVGLSGGRRPALKTVGLGMVPEGAMQDGFIQDPAAVQEAIRYAARQAGVRPSGTRAALSLGGSSVIIKKIGFPNKDDAELADLIESEAEQHFQHDIHDLHFTWHTLDSHPEDSERGVILVGAKRDLVEQHLAVVKRLGFKIGVIDCDVFALHQAFQHAYGILPGLHALVHVGASSTQVSLIGNDHYLYTRDLALGGQHYSRSLAGSLGISPQEAESVKINASQQIDGVPAQVQQALQKLNEQLAAEIQVTTDFFFQSGEAPLEFSALSGIHLGGGGARSLGLAATVGQTLGAPVQLIQPLQQIDVPRRVGAGTVAEQPEVYSIAIGLGLRALDERI